jgi:hypothetical protein
LPRAAPWDRAPPRDSVIASIATPQKTSTGTAAARTAEVASSVHELAPPTWRNGRAGAGPPPDKRREPWGRTRDRPACRTQRSAWFVQYARSRPADLRRRRPQAPAPAFGDISLPMGMPMTAPCQWQPRPSASERLWPATPGGRMAC